MKHSFRYFLLSIFVVAILLIVFLQFNSNRSIDRLINGNENMLNGFEVKANLQRLQTDIAALESKARGTVISDAGISPAHLDTEIKAITTSLQKVTTLTADSSVQPLLNRLNQLVTSRIRFHRSLLDTFRLQGKIAAERMINNQDSKLITDAIKNTCSQIDGLHQLAITSFTLQADRNGRRAKTLGVIIALIAVASVFFIFTYITYKVRQQQALIERLNISEKKARDAAAVKENFLANMSHEIRTPLNAVLGFTHLLQRKQLDAESAAYVQTIQHSGENLLHVVNDILDLSKIEAGMLRIEAAPFSLRLVVHSVEAMFQPRLAEKNVQMHVTIDDRLPDLLEGDATRLTQALVNLAGNAAKFTEKGIITIDVSGKETSPTTVNVVITVKDTGIGIEEEKLKTIFERFEQAEDSVTRKYGGTGLGLAIVKDLVELQNGSITVKSKPGEGTMFTIELPFRIVTDNRSATVLPEQKQLLPDEMKQVKLLVAEDNVMNQLLLRYLFDEKKIAYDVAANGKEVIELLKKNSYDLVLMDIQMPEMDGYTTTQEIRNTLHLQLPVIAMTAHAMTGEREKCLEYGMNEYISKPIREELLFDLIKKFVPTNNNNPTARNTLTGTTTNYTYINLDYLKEVGMGNRTYEKKITEQFMSLLPDQLLQLEMLYNQGKTNEVQQTAHSLKTTIAAMGLNPLLDPLLDKLEYNLLDEKEFTETYTALQLVCKHSLQEVQLFYQSIANS
ncbi:signal transduction histidine kinase [Lacibacter cauensis]|uniref:histidine kinase n=1 Tax=Lacibacter cauensis TaxID=510947 RepID=A0A562SXP5_9BACT|nr:ATP-binding protein [Lacibacter cauensis]TWI85490.1 signal transduction histidine kinase [Lacibacter cauensis]